MNIMQVGSDPSHMSSMNWSTDLSPQGGHAPGAQRRLSRRWLYSKRTLWIWQEKSVAEAGAQVLAAAGDGGEVGGQALDLGVAVVKKT